VLITTTADAHTHCQTRSCNERVKAKHGRHVCQTHACDERVRARHWRRLRRRLSPETTQMLERLRNCETRGIAYPTNYRYSGHHFGAYQYDWGPGSAADRAGFRVRPDLASPAEQDVRTALFYPSHRSEWTCRA
jgi:hypothetical protein